MRRLLIGLVVGLIFLPVFSTIAQDEDPPSYRVAEVIDLGVTSGPLNTAALLSPDGSRYAHFDSRGICLFSLPENEEEVCHQFESADRIRPNWETARWSPNGRYIAFQDIDALRIFRDSDIRIFDVETAELRNLTDDGHDGIGIVLNMDEIDSPVYVDIAVAWSDESELAILRYTIPSTNARPEEMEIIIADPETGETELLRDWTLQQPFLYYTLAWSGNTIAVGRSPSSRGEGDEGIDLFNTETGERERVIRPDSDNLQAVFSMQFSADGGYLLAYNAIFRSMFVGSVDSAEFDGIGMIEMPDGVGQPLDNDLFVLQAGFAPEGSAIAYVVQEWPHPENPQEGGLYIAPAPGEPAELVLPMERPDATTPQSITQLTWASNNTILIRDNTTQNATLVILEKSG